MDVIVQGQSSSCVCPVKGSGFTSDQSIVKPTGAMDEAGHLAVFGQMASEGGGLLTTSSPASSWMTLSTKLFDTNSANFLFYPGQSVSQKPVNHDSAAQESSTNQPLAPV
jgi:hypothetical protein